MKDIKKMIEDIIAFEAREEASEIISFSTEEEKEELYKYYSEDNGNIFCLVIDSIKNRLIEEGKMKSDGYFGIEL